MEKNHRQQSFATKDPRVLNTIRFLVYFVVCFFIGYYQGSTDIKHNYDTNSLILPLSITLVHPTPNRDSVVSVTKTIHQDTTFDFSSALANNPHVIPDSEQLGSNCHTIGYTNDCTRLVTARFGNQTLILGHPTPDLIDTLIHVPKQNWSEEQRRGWCEFVFKVSEMYLGRDHPLSRLSKLHWTVKRLSSLSQARSISNQTEPKMKTLI